MSMRFVSGIFLLISVLIFPIRAFAEGTEALALNEHFIACKTADEIKQLGCARVPDKDSQCRDHNKLAISFNSCIFNTASELIPEFSNTQSIDFQESWLTQYPLELLARNIAYRIYTLRDRTEGEQLSAYPFFRDIQLQIAFNYSNFDPILKDGFLNQHSVTHSNGTQDKVRRREAEELMSFISFNKVYQQNDIIKKLLPKYSFAVPTNDTPLLHAHEYQSNYGDVIAVLSDEVKKRSTFSYTDSLGSPTRCHSFNVNCLNEFKEGQYYFEGQIWGELNFTHVDYFLVNCYRPTIDQGEADKITQKSGIPVHDCKTKDINHGKLFAKNKLLAGDANYRSNVCQIIKVGLKKQLDEKVLIDAIRKGLEHEQRIVSCSAEFNQLLSRNQSLFDKDWELSLQMALKTQNEAKVINALVLLAAKQNDKEAFIGELENHALTKTKLTRSRFLKQMKETIQENASLKDKAMLLSYF